MKTEVHPHSVYHVDRVHRVYMKTRDMYVQVYHVVTTTRTHSTDNSYIHETSAHQTSWLYGMQSIIINHIIYRLPQMVLSRPLF